MTRLTLSLPMARAFRAGLKTQTRRVSAPRFKVGDVVAIAEPCVIQHSDDFVGEDNWDSHTLWCTYLADGDYLLCRDDNEIDRCWWMPTVENATPRGARYMPGWAERSRIKITEIREQALGDITEADAVREGFVSRDAFLAYFGTLHKGPIDLTRPVWAILFEVVT